MADTHRYVGESTHPVETAAVGTASIIEKGDLVFDSGSGVPKAASDYTWDTDTATTQRKFAADFIGVANDRSRAGDVDPIRASTRGRYEFACASASFEVGDLVGPAKASGNALENQKVVAVASADLAIGKVAKRGASVTRVTVDILSAKGVEGPVAGKDGLAKLTDPGNAGAIPVSWGGCKRAHVDLVTAGAETRTVADPGESGLELTLGFKTDGGDCVVTFASDITQTGGENVATFTDVGEILVVRSIAIASAFKWRQVVNIGAALT